MSKKTDEAMFKTGALNNNDVNVVDVTAAASGDDTLEAGQDHKGMGHSSVAFDPVRSEGAAHAEAADPFEADAPFEAAPPSKAAAPAEAAVPVKRPRGRPRKNPAAQTAASGTGAEGLSSDASADDAGGTERASARRSSRQRGFEADKNGRLRSSPGLRWSYMDPVASPAMAYRADGEVSYDGPSLHDVLSSIRPDDLAGEWESRSDGAVQQETDSQAEAAMRAVLKSIRPDDVCTASCKQPVESVNQEHGVALSSIISALRNEELHFSPEMSTHRAALTAAHAQDARELDAQEYDLPLFDQSSGAANSEHGSERPVTAMAATDPTFAGAGAHYASNAEARAHTRMSSSAVDVKSAPSDSDVEHSSASPTETDISAVKLGDLVRESNARSTEYDVERVVNNDIYRYSELEGAPGRFGVIAAVKDAATGNLDSFDDVSLSFNENSVTDYESDKERWLQSLNSIDSAESSESSSNDSGSSDGTVGLNGQESGSIPGAGESSCNAPVILASELEPQELAEHESFMAMAMELALKAEELAEVPVGAVVVSPDGQIAGIGYNRTIIGHDPTAHAEIMAIREAGKSIKNYRLVDCTLYVTLEPCCMCAMACVHARLKNVVYAAADPKTGACGSVFNILNSNKHNHKVNVIAGVLEQKSSAMLSNFFAELRKRKKAAAKALKGQQ